MIARRRFREAQIASRYCRDKFAEVKYLNITHARVKYYPEICICVSVRQYVSNQNISDGGESLPHVKDDTGALFWK